MNIVTIYRNDTLSLPVIVKDGNGNPYNLTGYTMKMTVKRHKDDLDADAVIGTKTATIVAPATGVGVFSFSSSDTNKTAGKYYYDVEISKSNDKKTVILDEFIILQDITKA